MSPDKINEITLNLDALKLTLEEAISYIDYLKLELGNPRQD